MGTSRNIGRNNVVFDYEMTARGSTQIFSLCWLSLASVHTPTSTPLFLSHCVKIFDSTLCLPFYFFFFIYFFSPKGDSIWPSVSFTGILHQMWCTQIWSHAESLSDQRTVETPYSVYIFCDAYLCSCTQTAMFTCIPGSRCSPLNPVRHTAGLHWKGCFLFLFPTCRLPVSWHHLFLK